MNVEKYYENLPLPGCAMSVNGEYLEEVIRGYMTSSVSGRTSFSSDIKNVEIGRTNGSRYINKKDKSKTITVSFALVSQNETKHYENINKINKILHDENLQIIFKDQDHMYYICNCDSVNIQEFDAGGSGVIACSGQISLTLSDPYKYSTKLYEVEPSLDNGYTFSVDYRGNVPAKPIFEATMKSDNGFIGYIDQDGNILQFGNVDEADKDPYEQNEYLVGLPTIIEASDDVGGKDYLHPLYGTKGTLTTTNWFGKTFLRLGTAGGQVGNANGGLRTITIPADSEGVTGAKNWYCYMHVLFYAGLMGQTGEMSVSFLTKDNKLIAAYNWHKADTTGNTGMFDFIVHNPNAQPNDMPQGRIIRQFTYTTSHLQTQNPWYWDWGHCDILKEGSSIRFFYYGQYYSYTIPEIENLECAKIQVAVKQWGDRSGDRFMTYAGFDTINFQKMNVSKWKDVPNKFSKDDVFLVDTKDGTVTLKGMPQYGLGAIGNAWDAFQLKPGNNQIKCVNSEWATKPDYKIKYREVYL